MKWRFVTSSVKRCCSDSRCPFSVEGRKRISNGLERGSFFFFFFLRTSVTSDDFVDFSDDFVDFSGDFVDFSDDYVDFWLY